MKAYPFLNYVRAQAAPPKSVPMYLAPVLSSQWFWALKGDIMILRAILQLIPDYF